MDLFLIWNTGHRRRTTLDLVSPDSAQEALEQREAPRQARDRSRWQAGPGSEEPRRSRRVEDRTARQAVRIGERGRDVPDSRLDRRFRIVADPAIRDLDDAPAAQLGERAGDVIRRFDEAHRRPGQGGDQAEQDHRTTQAGTLRISWFYATRSPTVKPIDSGQ
jgi:hypothetical protein